MSSFTMGEYLIQIGLFILHVTEKGLCFVGFFRRDEKGIIRDWIKKKNENLLVYIWKEKIGRTVKKVVSYATLEKF